MDLLKGIMHNPVSVACNGQQGLFAYLVCDLKLV
jgi:hypothetical protein